MESKVVVFLSGFSMMLMSICLIVLIWLPGLHTASKALMDNMMVDRRSVLSMLRDDSQLLQISEEEDRLRGHQIRLKVPSSVKMSEVKLSQDYINRQVSLMIPGIGKTYFYDYPMIGNSDGVRDVQFGVFGHKGVIDISLTHIYECKMTKEKKYIYLDFKRPHEIYKYVVVIDAGHGSRAPGANQGDILEKNINLAIVHQLKEIFDKKHHKNIGVYYTRLEDSNPDFPERVRLANDTKADAFVSVHINSTDSGRMSGIHGTSVLYLVADKSGKSKKLAQFCLDGLLRNLGSSSKGLVPGDEIYIIRKSKVPVALCEVGFLTNPQEQALLCSADYQHKAAKGIYEGILKMLGVKNE